MAMPIELAIWGNETSGLVGIFGGNLILVAMFTVILGLMILILLRIPLQIQVPFIAMLLMFVSLIVLPFQTILWLVLGVMVAFFAYKFVRGY